MKTAHFMAKPCQTATILCAGDSPVKYQVQAVGKPKAKIYEKIDLL